MHVGIVGATGGIGQAFLHHLLASDAITRVSAYARKPIELQHAKLQHYTLELSDETSIQQAAAATQAVEPLNWLLLATGVLHAGQDLQPEKSLRDLSTEQFLQSFMVNSIGPALIAKHFLPIMDHRSGSVFAALSARVGSIEDNHLGGWYSYRAAKAALNMIIKNLSIEIGRRYPHAIIVGLHPGTVDTQLSRPFQSRVPEDHLFSAEYATGELLKVLQQLTPKDSGCIFDYQGHRVPY